ncbi:MFS transporter [Gluconacetobacter sp. 1b LMG 1731]|uniref:MFS transporter n=1 Tax=Gluconacetobacter dulcium TaxID=2729096 RepID=A0A7W4ILH9_9PROT|nr:MFS transporter [Gluconacetobacter dulcium]MBB2165099.1 MFS transporter [Gluconacetobacter dulcium]MBB2194275.1 MFS transporter [Gluconacetobacter dulcium]
MGETGMVSRTIEQHGLSSFHKRLFLIGGSGYFFDALDVASLSFVLPALASLWHLSMTQTGAIGSSTFVGYFFGALTAGFSGDRHGRKRVMIAGLIIFSLGAFGCAASPGVTSFMLFRGIGGFGIGLESVIIAPYLTEFVPVRWRGRFAGGMAGFMSFGFLGAALAGYALVPQGANGWRIFTALCGLPIILAWWWARALKESPVWLESRGRTDEAADVLRTIYGSTVIVPQPGAPDRNQLPLPPTRLLTPGNRLTLFRTCGIWFFFMFSYYAFFTWMPQLLVLNGVTLSNSIYYSIATFGAQIPGYFVAAWLNDKIGSHRVLTIYVTCAAATCIGIALHPTIEAIRYGGMVLSFFLNGSNAAYYAFTPFVFPAALRARGAGLASSAGRIGAVIAPICMGAVYPLVGLRGIFLLIGAILFLAVLTVPARGAAVRTSGRIVAETSAAPP